MAKQQHLSPEKYIATRARLLPVAECLVNKHWQRDKMVSVVVKRRHSNGNLTVGFYLVDLFCLGVKDTTFLFNLSPQEVDERLDQTNMEHEPVSYNLAHNIVFAGVDFAEEFHISPEKGFSLTKYILEDDDNRIPVIDVQVGDEEGNPKLVVDHSYNYAPVLKKLQQYAGEGNYTFEVIDNFDDDDYDEDDDFEEEDDEDFDEDDFDEDEDDDFEDDDDFNELGDVRSSMPDFNTLANQTNKELRTLHRKSSMTAGIMINGELLLRRLNAIERGVIQKREDVEKSKDYQLLEKRRAEWEKTYERNLEKMDDQFHEMNDVIAALLPEASHREKMEPFLHLLDKYNDEDMLSFTVFNRLNMFVIMAEFSSLEEHFDRYPPSTQLGIVGYAVLLNKLNERYEKILRAPNVEMAYPFNRFITGMHHQLFFLVQALYAFRQNNKEKLLHYHNLLRLTGASGDLKILYSAQLETFLKRELGIEQEEELIDSVEEEIEPEP